MYRIFLPACLALALVATAARTNAHHAFAAEFDAEKKVTLVGTVVQMEWVNPHSWLTIDLAGRLRPRLPSVVEDGTISYQDWALKKRVQ